MMMAVVPIASFVGVTNDPTTDDDDATLNNCCYSIKNLFRKYFF